MHPWHDCYIDEALIARAFPVIIEIPKGSKNKRKPGRPKGSKKKPKQLAA